MWWSLGAVWPTGWALRSLVAPVVVTALDAVREYLHSAGAVPSLDNLSIILGYCVPIALETQYMLLCRVLALGFRRLAEHVHALQGPPRSPSGKYMTQANCVL